MAANPASSRRKGRELPNVSEQSPVDNRSAATSLNGRVERASAVPKAPSTSDSSAHRPRGRLRATLRVIRSNPTGRLTLRVGIALAGAVVVAVGLFLIPLPGPGWLIVIGGLAIWAVEFVWARHLLRFTRDRVRRWSRWVGQQSLLVRLGLGLLGLIFVCLVVWLSLKYSFGIDLAAKIWNYISTH
jgi:uncharacterized protein (TIGR02611 family)